MLEMTIREFIERYEVERGEGDRLRIPRANVAKKDVRAYIDANRQQIINDLAKIEEEKEANRPENKIEGYKEIKELKDRWYAYNRELSESFDDEVPRVLKRGPEIKVEDLYEKYPVAAAYIKAENWELSDNYAKSGAGKRAKKRIIDGDDYKAVIDDMEAEWSAHCEKHMWD